MKFKYYLFDWDGCLGDTLDIWLEAYKSRLNSMGVQVSDKQIVKDFFGTGYAGPEKYGLEGKKFYDEISQIVNNSLKTLRLNEGAREILKWVKDNGGKSAVVSTSYREVVMSALRFNQLEKFFDAIVCWEDTKEHKPDPEPLYKAMELLKVGSDLKSNVVMIGDSKHDIEAGKNAGIVACLYHSADHAKFYNIELLKDSNPEYIIKDFIELKDGLYENV